MSFHIPVLINGQFPDPAGADEEGLVAIGGDLSTSTLLKAYSRGIFPWFNDNVPLWWSPDPRFVLLPDALKVSNSMKTLIKKNIFTFTYNRSFETVIQSCAATVRKGQSGTWITPEMQKAYIELHRLGHAHSAETWLEGKLVGGLYGIRMGNIFFGESMFAHHTNASKFAFINWVEILKSMDVILIDCQSHTAHLESLGATMIPRQTFHAWLLKGGVTPIP